jgi:hypothetical protein
VGLGWGGSGGLRWRFTVAVYGGGLRTLFRVYGVRVPKTKIGYGVRLPKTDSFYGCRKRTLSTVAEVFHNKVRISHTLFTKNYTGDFEIAP